MAPKRLLEDPPSAASTEDDYSENDAVEEEENGVSNGVENEEEESEDEEGEEDEEVDDHRSKKIASNKSTVATPSKASDRQSSSAGSGDESGSESDSESGKSLPSPSASDFTIKPIMSKPIDDSKKPQKSAAKRNMIPARTKGVIAGSKRTNEGDIEGNESKKKKVSDGQDEDVRKGAGRLWSEDDETAILKGMIEYKSKKGADPIAEMGIFHEFIKKNLHADVSKNQLMEKIRRLKKKYQMIAEKSEDGKDPVFSKPNERKFYELSKKIWGHASANGVDDNAKKKKKPTQSKVSNSSAIALPKLNGEVNVEPEKACSNSSLLDGLLFSGKLLSHPEAAISIVKEALPLIGSSKAKELESKWVKLQEDEFQLYLKKIELVHESAKLLLEAKKSSKFQS